MAKSDVKVIFMYGMKSNIILIFLFFFLFPETSQGPYVGALVTATE